MRHLFWHPVLGRLRKAVSAIIPPEVHLGLMWWHPILGRLRAWFGIGTPTGRPAVFLGIINAEAVFLGKMDGSLSLGLINAKAQGLGTMEGSAVRLGKMPVRRGS